MTDQRGRLKVNDDFQTSIPHIYAAGDIIGFPALASTSMQQGRHAAWNITRDLRGDVRKPFEYLDKGQMATIGRKRAIAQIKTLRVSGFVAWLMWLVVHVYYLIGFKNRFMVIIQWAWSYFTYQRGARLIVSKDWHSYGKKPEAVNSESLGSPPKDKGI